MRLDEFDSRTCSIARAVELVGDRWTVVVLRDLFNGVRRFDGIQDHLGISRDVLTDRLRRLLEAGLVERRAYRPDGARKRHEYVLTPQGRDLRTVLTALMDFGDSHLAGPDGPPMSLTHRDCGAEVHAHLVCEAGHRLEATDRTTTVPLDGAARRTR